MGVWSLPWRWHILSIPLTTGRGISAETCGLDDVFPPDDLGSRPKALCKYICIYIYMSAAQRKGTWIVTSVFSEMTSQSVVHIPAQFTRRNHVVLSKLQIPALISVPHLIIWANSINVILFGLTNWLQTYSLFYDVTRISLYNETD